MYEGGILLVLVLTGMRVYADWDNWDCECVIHNAPVPRACTHRIRTNKRCCTPLCCLIPNAREPQLASPDARRT